MHGEHFGPSHQLCQPERIKHRRLAQNAHRIFATVAILVKFLHRLDDGGIIQHHKLSQLAQLGIKLAHERLLRPSQRRRVHAIAPNVRLQRIQPLPQRALFRRVEPIRLDDLISQRVQKPPRALLAVRPVLGLVHHPLQRAIIDVMRRPRRERLALEPSRELHHPSRRAPSSLASSSSRARSKTRRRASLERSSSPSSRRRRVASRRASRRVARRRAVVRASARARVRPRDARASRPRLPRATRDGRRAHGACAVPRELVHVR